MIKFIFNNQQYLLNESNKTIKNLGGLYIIGTERHESRRIDNQLQGRSGRQGDPGSSRFFLSSDDKLLSIFGKNTKRKIPVFKKKKSKQYNFLINYFEFTQKKVELFNYNKRQQLFEFDHILSVHRHWFYLKRKSLVQKNNKNLLLNYIENTYRELFNILSIMAIKKNR